MKNIKAEVGYNYEGQFVTGSALDVQQVESESDIARKVQEVGIAEVCSWLNRGMTIALQAEARNELRRANGHAPEASPRKKFAEMSADEQKEYRFNQAVNALVKATGCSKEQAEAIVSKTK